MRSCEVRLPYTALVTKFRPDMPLLWKNNQYIRWAQDTGYDGVEFHGLRPCVREVLSLPDNELKRKNEIKSGHVIFNPYANLKSILLRNSDPLRPGEKIAFYNLFLADNARAIAALHKLERVLAGNFPVVTYPYEVSGVHPFGEYRVSLIQTHPAVFNDESTAEDFIQAVKAEKCAGIVWDTYHALEKTTSGNRPLADWRRSLTKLLEAGAVGEVHVQAGRIFHNDPSVPSLEWLKGMTGGNPQYNSELGQMIRLVKSANPSIPFVVEISIESLLKAGILTTALLFLKPEQVKAVYRELQDYVRRV